MMYYVEVDKDGTTEIWKQEATPSLSVEAMSFHAKTQLLDELVSYGRELAEAQAAVDRLDNTPEYERIEV